LKVYRPAPKPEFTMHGIIYLIVNNGEDENTGSTENWWI